MDADVDIHDSRYVKGLFDRISTTYGYTNYLASFGFTERWRRQCVAKLPGLPPDSAGYDLMCGRGETWHQLLARHRSVSSLTGLDISSVMIEGARTQASQLEGVQIGLLEEDVFENTIAPASADFVISTFGIKTFNSAQLRHLATEVARVLKAGGRFSFIEVSDPKGWWLRGLYLFYLVRIMPIVEKVFLGYSYGFSMIGVYVSRFSDCSEFAGHLKACGLQVHQDRYFFGCATGVSGRKS
jgi:ubiquinone/menaquinone biosynthesis C-methylase UbiE